MKAVAKIFLIFLLTTTCGTDLIGQKANNAEADAQREEIQRYFGYENLLPAYLTLPMDVSQNSNERGYFTEVGFVFIILFPILFLYRIRKDHKLASICIMVILFFLNTIYVSTSYILSDAYLKTFHGSISNYTSLNDSLLESMLGQFYIGLNFIGRLWINLFDKISGSTDYITYPVLLVILLGVYWRAEKLGFGKRNVRIGILALFYTFFWLILSSGILWYGYLLIPLFTILLFLFLQNQELKFLKYSSLFLIIFWVGMSFANRISMVNMSKDYNENTIGISLINNVFFNRSLGKIDDKKLLGKVHPGLNKIKNNINREQNSLVLQIGTTLGYFIDNNTERCIIDFQLGFTDKIINRYVSKREITRALKAGNIRYILIDLNTHTLDRTPEQTLIRKFNSLLNYVNANDRLMLLGTDRLIENSNPNDARKHVNGLAGNIVYNGSYAVYEIL